MKYLLYDTDITRDEDEVWGSETIIVLLICVLLFMGGMMTLVIIRDAKKGAAAVSILLWILSTVVLLSPLFYLIISQLGSLAKYELSGDGVKLKWLFGSKLIPWKSIVYVALIPELGGSLGDPLKWTIRLFCAPVTPKLYQTGEDDARIFLNKIIDYIRIKYTEERLNEILKYLEENNIPYVGKEGNGRRYEFSSWIEDLNLCPNHLKDYIPEKRLIKGTDNPRSDKRRAALSRVLIIAWIITCAFAAAWLIVGMIEEPNSYGMAGMIIVCVSFILVFRYLLRQNDSFELQKDAVLLKQGGSVTVYKAEEIKRIAIVIGTTKGKTGRNIWGAYIMVDTSNRMEKSYLDMDRNFLFHGRDNLLIKGTYLRVEEFKKFAEAHGIPFTDIYDEDGNPLQQS